MFNKSRLAIVLLSAAILAGITAAALPARINLAKDRSALNSHERRVVAVAAVPETPAFQPQTMAIVPAPVIAPDASPFIGTGDNSAGGWMAK